MTMTIDPSQSIAFQGSLGAYSHLACLEMFPHLTPKPCESFDDAFNAVQNGDVLYAMIPIENSVAGRVAGDVRGCGHAAINTRYKEKNHGKAVKRPAHRSIQGAHAH